MTFIPNVLSIIDSNNSGIFASVSNYTGTWSDTTGYNSINITMSSTVSSSAGGIQIQFSNDKITSTTYNTDTYFTANSVYSKTFPIFMKYFRTVVNLSTSGNLSLNSRLDTVPTGKVNNIVNQYSNTQEPALDAFGKLRVTNPYTLIDLKITANTGTSQNNKNELMITYKSVGVPGATGYVETFPGYLKLQTDGAATQINQSQKYVCYQPGKSYLFLGSGIIQPIANTGSASGMIGRIGLFDDKNGVFFSCDGDGSINVNVRNNSSNNSISQNNWNIDKMDGSGNSGFDLDFNKNQLFVIDLEWLGVGKIRYGFYISGKIYYCHQIDNIGEFGPYMQTANLPIRYELQGTTGKSGYILQICSTVISEGGFNPIGFPFSYGLTGTASGFDENNWFPILALSGGNRATGGSYYHEQIIPQNLEILDTLNNNTTAFRIRFFLSPTNLTMASGTGFAWSLASPQFSRASIASNIPRSINTSTDYVTTSSTNFILYQGYFSSRGTVSITQLQNIFNSYTQIASDVDNVPDVVLIEVRKVVGNSSIVASINWQEFY